MDGVRSIRRSLIVTVTCLACILTLVADVEADPVRLRNGTATFSQTINNFQGPDQAVDGIFDGPTAGRSRGSTASAGPTARPPFGRRRPT
jgi:hypothetical protein